MMALIRANPVLLTPFLILLLNQRLPTANAQYMVEILEKTALGGHRAVVRCDATGANFGEDVVAFSFGMHAIGCALMAEPSLACSDVEKPELNATTQCIVDFAVVPRGNCSFSEKAYYVQTAKPSGYSALIIYNTKGQSPIPMSGSKFAELIQIPVVMVKYECMQSMIGYYSPEHGYMVTIKASPGYYDLVKYLFPFVIIVGICFVVLFISLMIRLCRERRRLARKRLPRSHLKKIPTKKYRKGDPEETCAICLEDFQESEKLRILPCKHAYHCKCIDPWLTKNRKVCPVCKRRVGPRSEDSSDTDDTDSERITRTSTDSAGSSTTLALANHDNDPLLRNAQPMATSSSHDFPYPHSAISSLQQLQTASSSVSAVHSVFVRATLNLGNFFHPSRCEQNATNNISAQNSTTIGNGNSVAATIQASAGSVDGNQLHPSDGFEELHLATTATQNANAFGRLRNGLNGIGNRLSGLIRRGNPTQNNPHLLLENEEDTSSVTREELDTLSRRTCETLDETNNSSLDGHSMTTMHSNRNLLSAATIDSDHPTKTTPDNVQQSPSAECQAENSLQDPSQTTTAAQVNANGVIIQPPEISSNNPVVAH